MPPAGDRERADRLSHINGNARQGLQGLAIHRRGTRRISSSEAQAEAERTALGAPLGDKASAEGGRGEPARGAQHEQGPGAAPFLSDLLGSQPCAQRWALPSGLRPAPKGGLATGQPECNGRATRRETPLLERPAHAVSAQRLAAEMWQAPSGHRPEESAAFILRRAWPSQPPRLDSLPSERRWRAPTRWPNAHAPSRPRTLHAPTE